MDKIKLYEDLFNSMLQLDKGGCVKLLKPVFDEAKHFIPQNKHNTIVPKLTNKAYSFSSVNNHDLNREVINLKIKKQENDNLPESINAGESIEAIIKLNTFRERPYASLKQALLNNKAFEVATIRYKEDNNVLNTINFHLEKESNNSFKLTMQKRTVTMDTLLQNVVDTTISDKKQVVLNLDSLNEYLNENTNQTEAEASL